MQNVPITEMSGEELATLLSGQYESLILAQQNIAAIKQELNRRAQKEVSDAHKSSKKDR